jgi:hypothetical protein
MKALVFNFIFCVILCGACSKQKETLPPYSPSVVDSTKIATVFYSEWLSPKGTGSINPGDTTYSGGGGGEGNPGKPAQVQFFSVNAAAITMEIINKGVIMAYCTLEGEGNIIRPLPATVMIKEFASTFSFILSPGKIQFIQTTTNPAGVTPISNKNKFRYIIIPPNKPLRCSRPLKEMSYKDVCQLFEVPE